MDQTIKKQWIKALHEPKVKQTTGILYDGHGYCCLGVLRKVMNPNDSSSLDGQTTELTDKQLKKAGLNHVQCNTLIELNDTYGYSFKDIAHYISEHL